MTIQPPFLGRNLGKGTDVEAWSSFSVWHVIVFPVKLLPPACILVSHQLCVSWLCFIVSLCCTIMFNCVTWTCVFFGFLPFQTPNCDTMKVAIVFVLLFATVLCRPVSRSFLSSQNLKITFAQLRIAFHFWLYFPPILKVVLVYVLRFFDSTCKYLCLLCRQERLLTVLRALRKWWVSWERERERARTTERERERAPHWLMLVVFTGEKTSTASPQETGSSGSSGPCSTCTGTISVKLIHLLSARLPNRQSRQSPQGPRNPGHPKSGLSHQKLCSFYVSQGLQLILWKEFYKIRQLCFKHTNTK